MGDIPAPCVVGAAISAQARRLAGACKASPSASSLIGGNLPRMADPSEFFDPFLQRVVKVKPGDVIIFKYTRDVLTAEKVAELEAILKAKLGEIPFIVVSKDFDVATYRPHVEREIHIA